MFATEDKLINVVTAEVAKECVKAWEDLGLNTTTFTSDDKKLVLVAGWGKQGDVALATEFVPAVTKPKAAANTKETAHAK